VAPRARVLLGGAEAGEDDEEAAAVAEAVARTEAAEAPTGTLSGGEAVAVTEAEGAERLSDAADGREPPDEQPPEAGTACSPRC
jgi:hypothetical protein